MTQRTRHWTCLVREAMDYGYLEPRAVADMALAYMSEYQVEDMCRINDLRSLDTQEEDEDD